MWPNKRTFLLKGLSSSLNLLKKRRIQLVLIRIFQWRFRSVRLSILCILLPQLSPDICSMRDDLGRSTKTKLFCLIMLYDTTNFIHRNGSSVMLLLFYTVVEWKINLQYIAVVTWAMLWSSWRFSRDLYTSGLFTIAIIAKRKIVFKSWRL